MSLPVTPEPDPVRVQRQNTEALLEHTNACLEREAERQQAIEDRLRDVPRTGNYRPDETDDRWATEWERDFARSTIEWERYA